MGKYLQAYVYYTDGGNSQRLDAGENARLGADSGGGVVVVGKPVGMRRGLAAMAAPFR